MLLPLISANVAFRYLYSSSGTTLIHAFPLSRRSLFRGAFLSGLILALSPVIAIMLVVLPMCKMEFSPLRLEDGFLVFRDSAGWLDIERYQLDISGWLLLVVTGLLTMIFVYALSVFAAILTGTKAAQVGVTFTLNFLLIFIVLLVSGYLDTFLIGFDSTFGMSLLIFLNPLLFFTNYGIFMFSSEGLFLLPFFIYLGVACAVVFAASRLYGRRRLERAGSPVCFRYAELAITYIITLAGMAGLGITVSFGMGEIYSFSIPGLLIGCVMGAAITFMVMTMLSRKTPKIFTLETLKSFGIFAIIGVLFIASTAFDITGYTDRVPAPERVESVELSLSSYPFKYPYTDPYAFYSGISIEASAKDDLRAVKEFHRSLIEGEKRQKNREEGRSYGYNSPMGWHGSASIKYSRKGAPPMSRMYEMYLSYTSDETREAFAGMQAFREAVTLKSLVGYENITSVKVDGSKYSLDLSEGKLRELAQCLDRDFLAMSPKEVALSGDTPKEMAEFKIEYRNPNEDSPRGYYTGSLTYTVTSFNKETLAWMERNL